MPKAPVTPASPVVIDVRAFALVGASQHLQQLLAEHAQIVATFPELRTNGQPTTNERRRSPRVALAVKPANGEHACAYCARPFVLNGSQRAALRKNADASIACARPRCRAKQKRDYMRDYFAKRRAAAKRNGATS